MANGRDGIWWAKPHTTVTTSGDTPPIHWCPLAIVNTVVSRDNLDPMAQGVCRYCGRPMP